MDTLFSSIYFLLSKVDLIAKEGKSASLKLPSEYLGFMPYFVKFFKRHPYSKEGDSAVLKIISLGIVECTLKY